MGRSRTDRISRQARPPGLPPRMAVATALRATIIGAALLVVVLMFAGLWLGLPPGVGQPGAPASASPMEPSASPVGGWGPLAVIRPQDGADTGRTEGVLRITDTCVSLESGGTVTLLFWPADRTTWGAESRAITFKNFDGSVVTVSDGDGVVLGGGGDSAVESGISGEEWVKRMVWVARPAPSCSLDRRWGVGGVGE